MYLLVKVIISEVSGISMHHLPWPESKRKSFAARPGSLLIITLAAGIFGETDDNGCNVPAVIYSGKFVILKICQSNKLSRALQDQSQVNNVRYG